MSKNSDEDFSLKEWVSKRAANQMGEGVSVPQGQNDHISILGSKAGQQPMALDRAVHRIQEHMQENPKMTRYTNGMQPAANGQALSGSATSAATATSTARASATPAQAVQQLQIVRLLQDLGERLRQSEKEREILWREVDGCRKLLTDIEDKTSKTEKAYITLEHKMQSQSGPSAEAQAELDKVTKALNDKIAAIETTAGSAILRIEDAIGENAKLARRLDQVGQDKARLLRKLDTMEETLTQTQEALKAKALVLLTDQALAVRTQLPQTPAWSGNDTLRMSQPQASAVPPEQIEPLVDANSLFRRNKRVGMNTPLIVALVAMGVLGGWAFSKIQIADGNGNNAVVSQATSVPQERSQEQLMADIARMANDVEPGAAEEASSAVNALRPDEQLAQQAEKAALAAFYGERFNGTTSDRIVADTSLPKVVKDIENKAFDGDAEAQHDLAAIYTAGHAGVKTNYAQAALWFNEAAHNNVANAQYNLGVLYHQGLGVKQDTRKAIQLYRVAAANNHPEAQYNLGIAHIEGVGADYSPRVATRYFEQAAAGGIVEAAYNLGLIQENGLLGDAQPDEAIFWYKTAADEGNAQAKQALAQVQKQMKLSDQDVARIHNQIAVDKPNAFNPKTLTEIGRAGVEETPAAQTPVPQTAPAQPKQAEAKPAPAGKARYETVIVTQIQEQLNRMGLYDGVADGNSNRATEEAVRSYQSMNKLKVDGEATEDVLVHMLANDLQMQEPAAN